MVITINKPTVKQVIPWAIAAIALGFILWFVFRKVPEPEPTQIMNSPVYVALQRQTDSLLKADRIATADSVRRKVIDSLGRSIQTKESRIKEIKKNVQKEVFNSGDITDEQLRRVLSEQARKHADLYR